MPDATPEPRARPKMQNYSRPEHLQDALLVIEEQRRNLTTTTRALDDAHATLASQAEALAAKEAEIARLSRVLADTNHEFRVTVLAYEDQEKEIATAEAALKAARETLIEIRDSHIGDQPSALDITEVEWVTRCHSRLRQIAAVFLALTKESPHAR